MNREAAPTARIVLLKINKKPITCETWEMSKTLKSMGGKGDHAIQYLSTWKHFHGIVPE